MTIPESLLARVRKLLAQAEDPAATPAEAEAFNTKAAELIAKYGIDQALLAAAGQQHDEITVRKISMNSPYSTDKAQLLSEIARALRCQSVHHGHGRTTRAVSIVGFTSDLERVELLYTSLLLQAIRHLVHVRPDTYYGEESTAAYRRTWLAGFTTAVYRRLHHAEATAAHQTPTTAAGDTSTALVLRDRSAHVEHAYHAAFPHLRTSRARQFSGSGYHDGHTAGTRADLGATPISDTRTAIGR